MQLDIWQKFSSLDNGPDSASGERVIKILGKDLRNLSVFIWLHLDCDIDSLKYCLQDIWKCKVSQDPIDHYRLERFVE